MSGINPFLVVRDQSGNYETSISANNSENPKILYKGLLEFEIYKNDLGERFRKEEIESFILTISSNDVVINGLSFNDYTSSLKRKEFGNFFDKFSIFYKNSAFDCVIKLTVNIKSQLEEPDEDIEEELEFETELFIEFINLPI